MMAIINYSVYLTLPLNPSLQGSYSIYISIFFPIIMRDSEGVTKKIFAQKVDRFRLKAVKRIESPGWKAPPSTRGINGCCHQHRRIECPGWKAGLYRSSQYI